MSNTTSNQASGSGSSVEAFWRDDYAPLQAAGKAVLMALRHDEESPPELFQRLSVSSPKSHYYYHPTNTTNTEEDCFVTHVRSVPLPPLVRRQLVQVRFASLMGLLPEANLAWMSIDDVLYVWSTLTLHEEHYNNDQMRMENIRMRRPPYDHNNNVQPPTDDSMEHNLMSYKIPTGQLVVSVGLTRPKKGVFKDMVEWCLVVTTPQEAILCALAREESYTNGVSPPASSTANTNTTPATTTPGPTTLFSRTNHPTGNSNTTPRTLSLLKLIPTRYMISTDGISLPSVCGTRNGRIFLGGANGILYEFAYETMMEDYYGYDDAHHQHPLTTEGRLDAFYAGNDAVVMEFDQGVASKIYKKSKRLLRHAIMEPPSSQQQQGRNKVRKLNHSSSIGAKLVSAVAPNFVVAMSSALLGGGGIMGQTSGNAGPIVQLLVDEDRSTIYTLSNNGWICVYDLNTKQGTATGACPLVSACDTCKTARIYLEAVARGRPSAPSTTFASPYLARIPFIGGGAAAQAGVGGMEGARSILKHADLQQQQQQQQQGSTRNGGRRRTTNSSSSSSSLLLPTSIHLIPTTESQKLTLVAITGGGLRYYLSSLSNTVLTGQYLRSKKPDQFAPSHKFTLLHIRAPPPLNDHGRIAMNTAGSADAFSSDDSGGFAPKLERTSNIPKITASYYKHGVSLLALEPSSNLGGRSSSSSSSPGDVILAATPDFTRRKTTDDMDTSSSMMAIPTTTTTTSTAIVNPALESQKLSVPGGISEMLNQPTASTVQTNVDPILPGGRIWEICPASSSSNKTSNRVLTLMQNSKTPSDSQLSVGLVPPYFPPTTTTTATKHKTSESGGALTTTPQTIIAQSFNNNLTSMMGTASTVAWNLLKDFLLSRPLNTHFQGFVTIPPLGQDRTHQLPLYRLSTRFAFGGLGSKGSNVRNVQPLTTTTTTTTTPTTTKRSTSKAARLSPWLLRPAAVPLNEFATQHLDPSSDMVALNVGGLHYFQYSSVLLHLRDAIVRAGANVGKDEHITKFFIDYGYPNGCSMCLSLAVVVGPGAANEELRHRALQAAFTRAYQPRLVPVNEPTTTTTNGGITPIVTQVQDNQDAAVPEGYSFSPSSVAEGFTMLLSRLLRPIWYKPAVVVTEGQTVTLKSGRPVRTPARVELLLDDATLEEIKKPLASLQDLSSKAFVKALQVVPGSQRRDSSAMDIDDNHGHLLLTQQMQQQGLLRGAAPTMNGAAVDQPRLTQAEMDTIARMVEERNIHCLYRLLSRTVQLLNLLSLLKWAQELPNMPDVEWGLIHGLTISQLVQTSRGQERMEHLLNALVSTAALPTIARSSADADLLAKRFGEQCYLYFSPGLQLGYLGFQSANLALTFPVQSAQRSSRSLNARNYLVRAARYWTSPQMITGRLLHPEDKNSNDEIANRAMQFDSPVAKAAAVLFQLQDVAGLVDVCLETAANFDGRASFHNRKTPEDPQSGMWWWERGLYHRRPNSKDSTSTPTPTATSSQTSSIVAVGAEVTPKDAVRTCYAVIFHHLSLLLLGTNMMLAEKMVAACAASDRKDFLHAFYAYLRDTNHVDTLIRIDSEQLEQWLIAQGDADMLWRYYVIQEKFDRAGDVMWRRACDDQQDIPLQERIVSLSRAQESFEKALNPTTRRQQQWNTTTATAAAAVPLIMRRDGVQLIYTQVCEFLDVARLQLQVLNAVDSRSIPLTPEAKKRLGFKLVPVSDIYNDYASPLNLFDVCLLILHSCRHKDEGRIQRLWRSIIAEEVLPTRTRSVLIHNFLQEFMSESLVDERVVMVNGESNGEESSADPVFENGDWLNSLRTRVVALGKQVYDKGTDYVFPVEFLVETLEDFRSLSSSSSTPWPLYILRDVGVPYPTILEAYERSIENEDREVMGGMAAQRRIQHLSSVVEVLTEWIRASDSSNIARHELVRAVGSGGLLTRIDKYEATLDGVGVTAEASVSNARATLKSNLQNIERELRRIG